MGKQSSSNPSHGWSVSYGETYGETLRNWGSSMTKPPWPRSFIGKTKPWRCRRWRRGRKQQWFPKENITYKRWVKLIKTHIYVKIYWRVYVLLVYFWGFPTKKGDLPTDKQNSMWFLPRKKLCWFWWYHGDIVGICGKANAIGTQHLEMVYPSQKNGKI